MVTKHWFLNNLKLKDGITESGKLCDVSLKNNNCTILYVFKTLRFFAWIRQTKQQMFFKRRISSEIRIQEQSYFGNNVN